VLGEVVDGDIVAADGALLELDGPVQDGLGLGERVVPQDFLKIDTRE
jgi:hypothetical protein